jgi:hypothetical protein
MMQFVVEGRGLLIGAAALMVVSSVTPADAQQGRGSIILGGDIGVAHTGDSWSGGGPGPLGAVYIDLPITTTGRVRFDAGLVSWSPSNEVLQGPPAGRVLLVHAGVTLLGYCENAAIKGCLPGVYYGFGLARYRYRIEHGEVARPTPRGLHVVAGVEHFPQGSLWGVQAEATLAFIGGPGHGQVWAYDLPQLSVTMGVNRRF